jgi:hypothetical protein
MTTFTGVLAVLHTRTADGRRLDDPHPALHRPLPLPLIRPGEPGIGRIDRVWLDGDLIRYAGIMDDDHPDAESIAAEIRTGRLVGMLDADVADMDYQHRGRAAFEPELAALADDPSDMTVVMRGWRVAAATLMPSGGKAWPEVSLNLDEEPTA